MGPSVAAVIVAAGRGLRAGGNLPKQYRELAGEPVIRSSLSLFAWHGQIGAVQAVIHPDDRGSYDAAAKGLRLLAPVSGGASRQASVRAGLEALAARAPDIVLIHDAARPFCSTELVSRAIVASTVAAQASSIDHEAFDRIEKRIDSLARQIEEVAQDRPGNAVMDRLGTLSNRVDELADRANLPEQAMERLGKQIAMIADKIDRAPAMPDHAPHSADLQSSSRRLRMRSRSGRTNDESCRVLRRRRRVGRRPHLRAGPHRPPG